MAKAAVPVDISWHGLAYSIKDKKAPDGKKMILHPQDGQVQNSSLTALMGPSGSGKTSLLNALAGRLPITKGACFEGLLEVNGLSIRELPCPFADISAYVEQEDVLYALSTVQETMDFAARLRLPSSTGAKEREVRIDDALKALGLVHVRNTNVGGSSFNGAIRGLSGGERKRLSIALELLHKPKVLFLDEPTTGLDSYQALNVMEKLRDLAVKDGCTVVVSIHQPRSSIFALLSGVYLLAGGNPIFAGPTEDATTYFAKLGYDLPPKFNPADFFIDLVSIDQRDESELERTEKQLAGLVESWKTRMASAAAGDGGDDVETVASKKKSILDARPESPAGHTAFFMPLAYLMQRGWREQMRDRTAVVFKCFFQAFFGMVFGLVYFQLGNDQRAIQDRMGILVFLTMNQAFGSVISTAQVIPRQLVIVNRDRANRLYSAFPFYISSVMVTIPVEAVPTIVNICIIYFMSNLGGEFWLFLALIMLENFCGISMGMALSASFKNVTMAPQIAPAVVILFLIFNGSFVNEESIPVYFLWLREISFIRYAFKAAAVNEFEGARFECDSSSAGYCIERGEQVLANLEFDTSNVVLQAVLILAGLSLVFNILAFAILIYRRPRFLVLQKPSHSITDVKLKTSPGPESSAPQKGDEVSNEIVMGS
eukprot:TRINITY_DN105872_c0_g1_i1.p1 TRINITY_DN105872_c0_g1~~TRINITY_DN105872_c0_g1_i1.p1  ORF type:complete len:681 (-),score=135.07 TRINITY_DN105872_c0_g1_i1:54-2021(-)